MLQLYREEYRKPDVGRVALGRGKRGQSAGAAHLSYPDPEAHPSSASAPTLYHIPSSHLISNMWRKVQQKYGGCLLTPPLRLIPLLICLSTCANTIYYVLLPVKYANQIWKDLCIPVLVTNIPARLGDGFLRNLLEKGLRAVWSSTQLAIFCTVLHFQTQTVDSTLHIRTQSQLLPCGTHAFLEQNAPQSISTQTLLAIWRSWVQLHLEAKMMQRCFNVRMSDHSCMKRPLAPFRAKRFWGAFQ